MAFGSSAIERIAVALVESEGRGPWPTLSPADREAYFAAARAALKAVRPFARYLADDLPAEPLLEDYAGIPKAHVAAQIFREMIDLALNDPAAP